MAPSSSCSTSRRAGAFSRASSSVRARFPSRMRSRASRFGPAGSTSPPPDRHLLLEPDRVRVLDGPREHRHRPGIDPLFRSAAEAYTERVVGVLLSGMLEDGTRGLEEIKRAGGLALVQDPEDALYRSMPESAISRHAAARNASAESLADLVVELAARKRPAAAGSA